MPDLGADEVPERDLILNGLAITGAPLGVSLLGSPSAHAWLLLGTASASIPLPGFGTLGIDLAQPYVLAGPFQLDARGVSTITQAIPNFPGLIGSSLILQGLVDSPTTNTWTLTEPRARTVR